jgi:diamine N-acetyltransferase
LGIRGRPGKSAAQLQKIYVLREFIGRKIGAALLGRVLPEAAVRAPVLWLDVLRENTHALRFYETHGFCVIGEDTHTIGAQTFAFDLMARDLR